MFDWRVGEASNSYRVVDGAKGGVWVASEIPALERAARLGAKVLVPVTDNGAIEFAHLQDPQANRFGVWPPKGERTPARR